MINKIGALQKKVFVPTKEYRAIEKQLAEIDSMFIPAREASLGKDTPQGMRIWNEQCALCDERERLIEKLNKIYDAQTA